LAIPSVHDLAPDFDEQAIVGAAQKGDQVALARLYEHYLPRVYRFVLARLGKSEDAEDVTEEVFLRIIDNIDGFSYRGLPFGAWVFRIARNEVVSHVRRQKTRAATAPLSDTIPDLSADHVSQLELQFDIDIVREATGRLPEAQRQVIEARFVAGLSVAETALALKKSENNVKVLQHKAIARLQQLLRRDA
jgi:RNA polymerase sigma-70 factor (ECF subfamily)